jgi:hypothetical protein
MRFMKSGFKLSLSSLLIFFFAVTAFASSYASRPKAAPDDQSVSGKISGVGDAEFTVAVAKDKQPSQNVEFFVDDKTRVEGKLAVGALVLVQYHSDSGRNIAVHVVVTPPATPSLSEQDASSEK